MKLQVLSSKSVLDRRAAEVVGAVVKSKPDAVLAFPTGDTPKGMYRELAVLHRQGLDFSRVDVFNLDEYARIDPAGSLSYATYMRGYFYDLVNVPAERRHIFNPNARDLTRECARYDRAIALAGGFDLAVLGVGRNGHVAFNEPGDMLTLASHVETLSPETVKVNYAGAMREARESASDVPDLDGYPSQALTVGLGPILAARSILVLVSGASKADVLKAMFSGAITTRLPASLLQLHPDCTVLADRQAAAGPP